MPVLEALSYKWEVCCLAHTQSCFLSIYRVVFDCRRTSKRDMYRVIDMVRSSVTGEG